MSGEEITKKAINISLEEVVPEPKAMLKGPKGPWPETQEKVLDLFIRHKSSPVFREELLGLFGGNRNPADKALQLLNLRLKKYGLQISGYQIYMVELTEPENQLRLFG
jgi:hypothetical protein